MNGRRLLPVLGLVAAGAAVVFATVALPSGAPDPTVSRPATAPGPSDSVPATTPSTTVASTAPATSTPPITAFRPQPPLFGEAAGVTLVFDGGGNDVLAVDPDQRLAARTTLAGHRAGDPPFRLIEEDGRLVVGWGEVYAVDVVTGDAVELGRATIYLPAAEPNRVWLVDYPQGFIGGGTPVVWQVDTRGVPVTEPVTFDVPGFPAMGIGGGLAVETEDGVVLWDAATGEATARLGAGPATVADASGSLLAWCDPACLELHITDLATGAEVVATGSAAEFTTFSFGGRPARFSPDRRHLAALAGNALVLVDTADGSAREVAWIPEGELAYVAWSPDGAQVFAASSSIGNGTTALVRYDVAERRATAATLPFGGTLGFVVLTAADGAPLLAPADVCRPPGVTTARPFCVRF